jgi:hypothetical protein
VKIERERIYPYQADSINNTGGELLEELLTLVNNKRIKIREKGKRSDVKHGWLEY